MTVTVTELAAALRIGDGSAAPPEPQFGILTRLLGVGDAFVDLQAAAAPEPVRDEATIRLAAYLYDSPAAARGDRYAAAWVNSGAAGLVSRWVVHRISQAAADGIVIAPGDGIDAATVAALIEQHRAISAAHHTPGQAGQDIEIGAVKPFARTGDTTPPTPADLAPNPQAARVLGLRTAGGQLILSWNEIVTQGFFIALQTEPTPTQIAVGGLAAGGGHVLIQPPDGPAEIWVRYFAASPLVKVATFSDHIVRPGDDGQFPAAASNRGRIAVGANGFYRSVNHGHAKAVTFVEYGPTRTGPPTRSAQELLYAGSFADPPSGHFVVGAVAWDRGSEVWLQNQTADDDDWASYSGPSGYHSGRLYQTKGDAAVHVANASEIGDVYIIGHGAAQKPFIVTAVTPAAADDWQWDFIGTSIQDVAEQVTAHNESNTAHSGLFQSQAGLINGLQAQIDAFAAVAGITSEAAAALISIHNASANAHPDLRSLIDAKLGITIYSSTATYTRGDIVEHTGGGLFLYVSGVSRSSDHDPGMRPGYWLQLNEAVTYFVMGDANYTIAARTIVVFDDTDEIFLCTTNQHTARNKAYVRSQAASIGGAFIQVGYATIPRDKIPPVREWTLNEDYRKGEIVDTTGTGHVHFIALVDNNSSSISNRKQPGTPGGVGTWDQLFTADNPPPPAAGGLSAGAVLYNSNFNYQATDGARTFEQVGTFTLPTSGWGAIRWAGNPIKSVEYHFFRFEELPVSTAGTDANTLSNVAAIGLTGAGSGTFWLGRTSARKFLIGAVNAQSDGMPLIVRDMS